MTEHMRWSNAISTRPSLEAAIVEAVERAKKLLDAPADLAIVFISSAFASEFSRVAPLIAEHLQVNVLIGCSGGGVVGRDAQGETQEIEDQPALSLSLAYLPGVNVTPFHITAEDLPDMDSSPIQWTELIGVPMETHPHFIVLADPFSSSITDLLQGLDYAYPTAVKVGGLASAGSVSRSSGLFCNDRYFQEGAVGVALSGNIVLEAIVAQGCRPIGQPYQIAEGERNVVVSLEASPSDTSGFSEPQPPLTILQELFQTLDEDDRALAQHSLFVGIARDAFQQTLHQGDFLIRNLLGVDPKTGAIAIGDRVRPGQRIQFHLRDARASADDLELLLQRYETHLKSESSTPAGALMFACMGRGAGLYGKPNFDSRLFSEFFDVPLSGFFCGGEIGPVGDATFLHGYTSVLGICRPLST